MLRYDEEDEEYEEDLEEIEAEEEEILDEELEEEEYLDFLDEEEEEDDARDPIEVGVCRQVGRVADVLVDPVDCAGEEREDQRGDRRGSDEEPGEDLGFAAAPKDTFRYAGKMRPGKRSPTRAVPDSIPKPDYARDGKPKARGPMLPWQIEVKTPKQIEGMRAAALVAPRRAASTVSWGRGCVSGVLTGAKISAVSRIGRSSQSSEVVCA